MATVMASGSGLRSPPTPRSSAPSPRPSAPSPRPTFDSDLLRAYMKKLLQTTLQSASWPEPRDRDKVKAWMKEIGERVKERMIGPTEIQPRGFKYIVLTQINENLGQGGRADLVCHWEDSDAVAQEVFANLLYPSRCAAVRRRLLPYPAVLRTVVRRYPSIMTLAGRVALHEHGSKIPGSSTRSPQLRRCRTACTRTKQV
ncbi:hypothetical protein C8Q70DRAFT_490500 [Cubamyces menziesii]|nr:hypothetical protein C8Q70DRAFT_490500 [Cubamyces menziesii]